MAFRRPRRGCRTYLQSLFTIFVFAVLLLIGAGWFFWRALEEPYKGYPEPARQVEVRKGQRASSILRQLQSAGVVRDEYVPLIYMKLLRNSDSLKAGLYEFNKPMSPVQVIEKIVRGDVVARTVTIREGLDRFAVGKLFAAEGFGRQPDWDKLTADPELIRDIAPQATSLEGYLFPDTYKFNPGTSPGTIVQEMVQNFRRNYGSEMAYITTGLDPHQTVTLASIIETEARLPEERPVVASVYLNRLRKHMLLGADPTVIYGMKLAGRWNGNIRKADLQLDSPYNTYRVPGLPPGPIANPGLASLRAATAPASTEFLYFVARHDGSHAFSRNLEEHNRNVETFQRQWFRDQRAAAAPSSTAPVTSTAMRPQQ
ncbi:MAG: endolytic transglycosylase MltG [Thermoanaerobaculia bacterium]